MVLGEQLHFTGDLGTLDLQSSLEDSLWANIDDGLWDRLDSSVYHSLWNSFRWRLGRVLNARLR